MELIPTLWILKHKIKNEAGIPIEFKDHKFMYDLYNDMSPLQVWLKPPQIGATVAQIVKTLWCARNNKWDIIYTLPTATDVNDMAGGKINRIIAQNPILGRWVKDHDTVDQKAVGQNIIHYRGTFSNKQAMMVSSDLNVHDEVDASDASVIQQYETRLQAKADGRRWYFSHPSIAGFGVDIQWQKSDKKEWFVTCPECKAEQQLKFPDNINLVSREYMCSACNAPMSKDTRRGGVWKATSKGEFSGYHISQLMCPWITADKILKDYEEKDQQYFYNYVLGLPYVGSENKIDPGTVLKNVVNKVNGQEGTIVIGVDTGLPIHYVIANKDGVFFYNKCKAPSATYSPYTELEGYLKRWPQAIIVADQGGDLVGIRELQAKYSGRVFLCYYRRDRKSKEMIKWGTGSDWGVVTVDRNRMMQMIVEQLRDVGRIRFNGVPEDYRELAEHFGNMYRTAKETPFGVEYIWERNGPDHFAHSMLYSFVGLDRYNQTEAKVVGANTLGSLQVGKLFE
jgi:hypothetical protein